ncbi:putative peptidase [Formosa agariphila KMM 3901]|uniref:Putative peptidase n=1 Tax=Formosa agariphila (strain DSM 15362 / KCTC 12365 / LMG 23005 / KMM 3901 / M-2Alg 35-1) TaxID=1347342 RepID=T2KHH0_FORAG|nr:zinc-dependent metalloprotease family protein [Formosa agariphila]CDF77856.1 putative peptidase [Formosa agariphila KMM 3901]
MKNLYTKKLLLLLLVSLQFNFIFAQSTSKFWRNVSNERVANKTLERKTHPENYQVFHLELEAFKAALTQAPLSDKNRNTSGIIMEFPMSDGTFQLFEVTESSILAPKLAAKFPMIKTYKGIGVDDKTATMRFSITQNGLHVFSLSGQRTSLFIDPYTVDGNKYMVYNRSDLGIGNQDFECLTDENIDLKSLKVEQSTSRSNTDDSTLRTFRLALSCNASYGALFAGSGTDAQKKANIQAQMAITINRVNEVYERDLAITLVFIDRNDELLYYDIENDPWDNEFSTKTQQVISTTLNDESLYDIGHNFNTTIGGNSGCIGCVCVDAVEPFTGEISKGRGYTGMNNPTGDAFDIDFVSHEMGHQFGAWHTMNTCSRSGNGISEVEPASGSSIMGYSGVCGVNNVQTNSDAHFNYVNIRDISLNIQAGGNSTCGEQTALANQPPVALAGQDYTIPVSTPFVLRGKGTDPDGTETLTYNWSQNDPERAPSDGAPQSTWTVGPLYRSILPSNSPDRYLPNLTDVVAGNLTPKWEVTPSVARTMNFALTVRDNGSGYPIGIGQVSSDLMTVNVVDGTPFTVTKPNVTNNWYVGISRSIEWVVGETNKAPINSQKVNIKLSLDGGLTYPISLAENVDNDGVETIIVPNYESDNCRIMVEAADNIFYDISDADFSIKRSGPIFVIEQTNQDEMYMVCNDAASINIPLTYTTVSGFNEVTTFSATNLPTGVTASFTPSNAQTNTAVVLTLTNFSGAAIAARDINIIGTASTMTETIVATIDVEASDIDAPNLLSPSNGATEVSENSTLSWAAVTHASEYELELSTSSNFSGTVNRYQVTENQFDFQDLEPLTTYYWRVRAINDCTVSGNSQVFSFTTSLCTVCESYGNNTVATLQTSTTRVVFNTIDNVSGKSGYSDFTSLANRVVRGEDYPLSVYVNTSGDYTTKTIVWIDWNNNCDFNDVGELYELGEATNVTNGITGGSPLVITVPLDAVLNDDTRMRVSTKYRTNPGSCETMFDGEVEDYKLNIVPTLSVEDHAFSDFGVWPNPNNGSFTVSLTSTSANAIDVVLYDISGRRVFSKAYQNTYTFSQNIVLDQVSSGLYLLEVSDGIHRSIKKVVIE